LLAHSIHFLQGLAVDKDVKAGKVTPGQYLILSFNFARINRSGDFKVAETALKNMINGSIKQFYSTYASYLGSNTDEELMQKLIQPEDAIYSLAECIRMVQKTLRAMKGVSNHPLADVKGVSNRSCLSRQFVELSLMLEFVLLPDLSPGRRIRCF